MCLKIHDKIKTNYSDIIYTVTRVSKICTCTDYIAALEGSKKPSKPHYHFVCSMADKTDCRWTKGPFYLNGYNIVNGKIKSVWCADEIIMITDKPKKSGRAPGQHSATNIEKELKDRRLTLRAAHTTIRKLYWIREHSNKYKGLSESEIISRLIDEHVLMQELYHEQLPRFK